MTKGRNRYVTVFIKIPVKEVCTKEAFVALAINWVTKSRNYGFPFLHGMDKVRYYERVLMVQHFKLCFLKTE